MAFHRSKDTGDDDAIPLRSPHTVCLSDSKNPEEKAECNVSEPANPKTLPSHAVDKPPHYPPPDVEQGVSDLRSPENIQGTVTSASQGNAGQISGSGNEGHGKLMEFAATFANWSGAISFAGSISTIGIRVGINALDVKKRTELNASATCMVCAFIISVFLLVVAKVLPTPTNPTGVFVRVIIALIASLLIGAIILALLLAY